MQFVHYVKTILLIGFIFSTCFVSAQEGDDSLLYTIHYNDSIITPHKRPWKAALETFGLNIGIWGFDRIVLNGDYTYISIESMKKNLQSGFVWDNDQFSTNLFSHPYAGGLYFNTARANGMDFYQSIPYAAGGSLMWELFMENEPPAINDFISTSIGGMSLGEVTYRLSDLVLNDKTTGWERFGRELLAMAISPMRGFNRLIDGDMWKRRNIKGRAFGNIPASFLMRGMYRALTENTEFNEGISNSFYVDVRLLYGDPFDYGCEKPYDYFSLRAGFNLISDEQPLLSNVNAIGMLWGKDMELEREKRQLVLGIFQHFDYYDSYASVYNVTKHSYRISEAAAFGGGLLYRQGFRKNNNFLLAAHLNGIILGGSLTNHYDAIDRDYNMGSGYSAKFKTTFLFSSRFEAIFNFENYQIFTWKGYEPNVNLSELSKEEQLNLNVQGDKGFARLSVLNLCFNYHLTKHFDLSADLSYYNRKSHYVYYPDVKYTVSEAKAGVGYCF